METSAAEEEFITIVPVGENKPPVLDPSFVTVLTVGAAGGAAEVTVQRPRGARLGLGLKFEGGSAAAENVRRLLVQSCADDSPAANAITPWGNLLPGDEILAIDGVSVSELTRIDCVRRLKDSDEKLTLLVRHFESSDKMDIKMLNEKEAPITTALVNEITRPTSLPPPVPPRKLGKKNSFKDKTTLPTVGEQNALINVDQPTKTEKLTSSQNTNVTKLSRKSSFDSHLFRQNKESLACLKKGSPEEVRRLVRRLSDGKAIPPEAEVYIDLLSNEWERCLALADAESDDTGSSISTVIDRLGSMANSVENSIPSTPIMQPKSIDIQKVLNSIENIDDNILKDMTIKKLKEQKTDINENCMILDKSLVSNNLKIKMVASANLQVSEENNLISNKKLQSDKNNNNTDENIMPKAEKKETVSNKQDGVQEKPKPMPRNTKVERSASERKRKPIPIPEPPPNPIVDQLLTPTKKNCIETWLQRSEAEMNNKTADKLEVPAVPEILPRLIDFVPKNQFVESSNETQTCIRPTTAPPPPPVDPREDGSGASLDTIGELDESSDVTDNAKQRPDNDSPKRKSSFDKLYWNERLNRSDAEDKSLSNDEAPVPTCPRQPPDGVETPSDAIEKIPDLPTRLPPRLPANWPTTRPRLSFTSRSQDARSEASVKDKIAMFSSDLAISSDRIDKICGTLPVRSHSTIRKSVTPCVKNYTEISSLDRRLTKSQDNLDETPRMYKRHTERPEVLGGGENTIIETKPIKCIQKQVLQKPLFYGSTNTLASEATFTRPVFHGRSISEDNSSKHSGSHKSNLEYLIEQRKKSMSKLRGLVIPEMQAPIIDLPEIKVKDNLSKMFLQKSIKPEVKSETKVSNVRALTFNDSKWKTNFLPNNLPKYSPAFKRKSLQVYTPTSCLSKESTPERKFAEKVETINKINAVQSLHKPLRASAELSRTHYINSPLVYKQYDKNNFNNTHNFKNVEVKICTTTEVVDSDNDSAMSSTQSSYRSSASSPMQHLDHVESDNSRMSPKILHYATYVKSDFLAKPIHIDKNSDEYIKRKVCRSVSSETNVSLSSSAGSGATSGSQASCSSLESSVADSDKRRVSKTYNVDTINRRNILASAKCRSGRDAKLNSPVIETKFSHEPHDRSPSPISRPPERLSTLPLNVSVITNKGDSRRRNKIVVESDSDSESEITIRQRKSDFKNSRLKRNLSANNKTKQNGVPVENDRNDEVPQVIKDKIMSEINKAGLDDYNRISKKTSSENSKVYPGTTLNNHNYRFVKNEENINTNTQGQKDLKSRINVKSTTPLNLKITSSQLPKNDTQQHECKDIGKIETQIIHLKKENGSGVGLILAGGTDCEAKDVTVHRVLSDSIAAKAGIKKGTKIKSINGCPMTGLTHAQSVTILKEQRSEVIIEFENERNGISNNCGSDKAESKGKTIVKDDKKTNASEVTVLLEKAGGGAGLGFGLDGGRDSPNGDKPLTVKKLFAGGAAAQSGRVLVGAELLSAGGQSFEGFTRTQAWAALKALPAGQVALVLKNPINSNN
ncbi:uncharacterized protein LOC123716523 [Pieris brassicae]|uniref:uncharacterized protein LOC123716523 n=1 Tax=Pieris brassicae TaxID=7116 RepID=UPI001E6609C5|nr:uncharacterized protein LOC123716523 [Pieris brassicae]XP_045528263.1 uncharacterized protein LOC123716523 [Pieris brassicae]XP_045528264.1 uncharacterized protein LOC123716523 [Pieris brassicae]